MSLLLCLCNENVRMQFLVCLCECVYLWGGDKGMCGWVGIIPGCEVPVEGGDDGVLFSLLDVFPG